MTFEEFVKAFLNPATVTGEFLAECAYHTLSIFEALTPENKGELAEKLYFEYQLFKKIEPNEDENSLKWVKIVMGTLAYQITLQGSKLNTPKRSDTIFRRDEQYMICVRTIEKPKSRPNNPANFN